MTSGNSGNGSPGGGYPNHNYGGGNAPYNPSNSGGPGYGGGQSHQQGYGPGYGQPGYPQQGPGQQSYGQQGQQYGSGGQPGPQYGAGYGQPGQPGQPGPWVQGGNGPAAPYGNPNPSNGKGNKTPLLIIGALILAILLVGGIFFFVNRDKEDPAPPSPSSTPATSTGAMSDSLGTSETSTSTSDFIPRSQMPDAKFASSMPHGITSYLRSCRDMRYTWERRSKPNEEMPGQQCTGKTGSPLADQEVDLIDYRAYGEDNIGHFKSQGGIIVSDTPDDFAAYVETDPGEWLLNVVNPAAGHTMEIEKVAGGEEAAKNVLRSLGYKVP
ncbi:hypothetical protein [Corynebacterium heidelbergense]|uniref:Uncharacterized protein n=1 Tax=Corynebacterium heidelbergense TaxID=2055947 RepID=A0A364V8I3_9CORY|nr:hypothetical protein [Corynebacterium heidelbergense]RAV32973.1 hypothetical protein DLJ54_00815 [Corynebacterium heidelbergense]